MSAGSVEADTKVLDDPEYLIPWELWCYYVWGFGISSMKVNNSSSAQDEALWKAASAAKQWSQRFRPAAPQVRTRKALAGNPGKHLTKGLCTSLQREPVPAYFSAWIFNASQSAESWVEVNFQF